jgi:hypothetical protein
VLLHLGVVLEDDLGDRADEAEHREDDGEQRQRAEPLVEAEADEGEQERCIS